VPKQHTLKTYRGLEVKPHAFLIGVNGKPQALNTSPLRKESRMFSAQEAGTVPELCPPEVEPWSSSS